MEKKDIKISAQLEIDDKEYQPLVDPICLLLSESRKIVSSSVNRIMIETYWSIGRYIVEFEQKGQAKVAYGKSPLTRLSQILTAQFGRGFSRPNLVNMRKFYLVYPNCQSLTDNLSWTHICQLLQIDDDLERSFYEKECASQKWDVRTLKRQMSSALYLRLAVSKDKDGILQLAKQGIVVNKPEDIIRDSYTLEFLGIPEDYRYSETELEQKLIDNLQAFLLELGKGFTFVGRQVRLTFAEEHFYIDLVFYNRLLKSFVLIDLKRGKLKHQDIGQMQMYVNYYDREIKLEDENPTIGLLLCADKDNAVVEYTLPQDNNQIFAAKYATVLPSKAELQKLILNK